MKKKISVIIPIYNVEDYLDECVTSVCNQTYTNLEILLIDDGATDGSGTIADAWGAKDSRCKVFHRENVGLSGARNYGITRATGEFLVFVDSDDVLELNMIERMYAELDNDRTVGISCCGIKRRTDSGDYEKKYQVPSRMYTPEEYLYEMYSMENGKGDNDMFLPLVVAWNKMYRREVFEDIRYPEGRVHEDNAVIHHLIYAAGRIKWINEPLYIYRERPNSIMKSAFSEKRIDDFYAQTDRLHFLKEKISNVVLMDMMVKRCLDTGRRYWCKAKKAKVLSEKKEKKFLQDIKQTYGMFVTKNTFSGLHKVMWFFFLHTTKLYYIVWAGMHVVKQSGN